jgi:sRNA-binding carbon storage regulator CsrA
MLVLSRRLGESVVVNDRLVLTVAFLADDYAELSLINIDGTFVGSFNVHRDEWIRLTDDVQVIVVQFEGEKLRLGIDGAPHDRIHRGEFWNLPG